jgi:hypothetical protein
VLLEVKTNCLLDGNRYEALVVVETSASLFFYDTCPKDKINILLDVIKLKYKNSKIRIFHRDLPPKVDLFHDLEIKFLAQNAPYQVQILPLEKRVRLAPLDKKKKVLIVDDSKTIHSILKKMIDEMDEFTIVGQIMDPREVAPFLEKSAIKT